MNYWNKCYYNRWNIGFIEQSASELICSQRTTFSVRWLQHCLYDRFFADPFILSYDSHTIQVLVEEYPYDIKRGLISRLIIDRKSYTLLDKKVLLDMPFHQSFPYIYRSGSRIYVIPESSASGHLYRYTYNEQNCTLSQQEVLLLERVLDPTFVCHQENEYLFCTKRGEGANSDLYLYSRDMNQPNASFRPCCRQPICHDADAARPAGYILSIGDTLYRVTQVCSRQYGEWVKVYRITDLSPDTFSQEFVKDIHLELSPFHSAFHTLNGWNELTVVDGIKREFRPLLRLKCECKYMMSFLKDLLVLQTRSLSQRKKTTLQ